MSRLRQLVQLCRALFAIAMVPGLYFLGFIATWTMTVDGKLNLNSDRGAWLQNFYSPLFDLDRRSPRFHDFLKSCAQPF